MANIREIASAIKCGFCLRQGVALPDPRQLTCSHVHCLECLTGFYDENNILICPWEDCSQVCEVSLNQLPAYDTVKDEPKTCDLCAKKGKNDQLALSYCSRCDTIYCIKHHELHKKYHKEIGKVHPTIDMEEYKLLKSQQSRVCVDHNNKIISLGCRKCLKMNCLGCVSSVGTCDDDESHQLMPLDELVDQLNDEINKLMKLMIEKEEALEQIFKFTTQTLAEYDKETAETLKIIHDKQDLQNKPLELNYKQLLNDYGDNQVKTKLAVTDFLEDKILKKWRQIRNIMRATESRAKHAHQCDIVSNYSDTKDEIQRLIDEIMPSVQVPSVKKVREKTFYGKEASYV
ncbi:uncharacterized protein [Watersipora subatra]|uniref:uncharacterized protein n=1 Tax=Watersipora subatra TaxID=2589382 RepID=UPI00355B9538